VPKDHYRKPTSGKGVGGNSWIWAFCWRLHSDDTCIVCGFEETDGKKCGAFYSAAATSSVQKHLREFHKVQVDARTGAIMSHVPDGYQFTDARRLDPKKFFAMDDARARALARWLVLDYRFASLASSADPFYCSPLSLPHTPAFSQFCHVLDKTWNVPSADTLEKATVQLFEEIRTELRAALKEAAFVAVTADSWSSDAGDSYVGITGHWIDREWQLQSCCLDVRQFTGAF
jgi:hypothetical protein